MEEKIKPRENTMEIFMDQKTKQRKCLATRSFDAGDLLYFDTPLLAPLTQEEDRHNLPWHLVAALFRFTKRKNIHDPIRYVSERYSKNSIVIEKRWDTVDETNLNDYVKQHQVSRKGIRTLLDHLCDNVIRVHIFSRLRKSRVLFHTYSYLNHSCEPTCKLISVIKDGRYLGTHLVARCVIQKGDELTLPYVSASSNVVLKTGDLESIENLDLYSISPNKRERQQILFHWFGFTCTCKRCESLSSVKKGPQ